MRLHAACILQDAAAARQLLAALRPALDDFKSTMILFAGTNADPAGDLGLFGSRRALRDATLHVPLFVWRRDLQSLPRVASPVAELVDVTPTVALALASPPPEGARGADLLGLVRSQESGDRAAFATWEDRIFSVRTSRERLVCNPNDMETLGWPPGPARAAREELFDERLDPRERENLASGPSQRLEEMRMRLERARATVIPRPPRLERDAARLELLEDEGIHKGDGHPTGALPSSSCGGGRQ
jgi:arylsulfatase A-like enzyme